MNPLRRTGVIVAAVMVGSTAPALLAQSEKVSVRMAPRPDQTVRMTMTQDIDFNMSIDGAGLPGDGPLKMLMRLTTAMTQKTGPAKADGTIDAELTYDQPRTEISMNGQRMPAPDANNQLAGQVIVVTFGRNGEVVGIKGLDAAGLTDEAFRQLMGSFSNNMPATALSVGETTTVPMDLMLPVPLPLPGGAPRKTTTGETRLTLVSIDKDAQGRSARFASTADGKMVTEFPSPDGKSKMTLDFRIGSDGTMVMDLDKGVLRSNVSTSTFEGKLDVPAGVVPGGAPAIIMRGTMKMTMTSN